MEEKNDKIVVRPAMLYVLEMVALTKKTGSRAEDEDFYWK